VPLSAESKLSHVATDPQALRCSACGKGALARDHVRSAFWAGEGLVVIEGIPAFVCDHCGEQFFEDETAMRIDLMRGRGFPADHVAHTMTVPVFRFEAAHGRGGGGADEA